LISNILQHIVKCKSLGFDRLVSLLLLKDSKDPKQVSVDLQKWDMPNLALLLELLLIVAEIAF